MRERGWSEPVWSLGPWGPHMGRRWLASTQARQSRSGSGVSDRPLGALGHIMWGVGEQLTVRDRSWVSAVNIPFPVQSWLPPREGRKEGPPFAEGGTEAWKAAQPKGLSSWKGNSHQSSRLGAAGRAQERGGRARLSHGPRREAPIPPHTAGLLPKVPERRPLSRSTGTV